MPATLTKPVSQTPSPVRGSYTVADWVAFEVDKERKHELRNGKFVEMAGTSVEHNAINYEYGRALGNRIEEAGVDCVVFGSDQKVYIDGENGFYPDTVVVCGDPMVTPDEALQNPVLVVEVLSESTAAYDRGEKFRKYRARPTLRHYVMVEQNRPSVEHYERGENGVWSLVAEHHALDETLTVTLNGAEISLPLAAIYRRVTFQAVETGAEETAG